MKFVFYKEETMIPEDMRCYNCTHNNTDSCPMAHWVSYDDDGWSEWDLVTKNHDDDYCSRFEKAQ